MTTQFSKICCVFMSFFLTVILVIIVGTVFNRFLLNWGKLVSDVGSDGAWFISAIYHLIYGVFIGIGLTLSIFVVRHLSKQVSLLTIILTSICSIMIFDYGLAIFGANTLSFYILILLLVILSFSFSILFTITLNKIVVGRK